MIQRVLITEAASKLIDELKEEHGPLIFHQSGGCCDGSAPMCFPEGDLMMNDSDILLGEINDCPFYMSVDQFNYWKHTQLTIDVVQGRGASFSVEIPRGVRFIVKSRLFTAEEMDNLAPVSSPA
jgi:uncharacterized protein